MSKKYFLKINKTDFLVICFVFSFFLSQFYLWESGLPQFSHIFIFFAIPFFFIKTTIIKIDNIKILIFFILYVVFVNLIWSIIYSFESYFVSTTYWLFNLLFFLIVVNLNDKNVEKFLRVILFLIPVSYLMEVVIWGVGIGRSDFSPRYNGLFNDPNQMAFWVLSTCAIYILLSKKIMLNYIIYTVAIFLITLTMSRSAFIGVFFLTVALLLKQKGGLDKKILLVIFSFFIFSIASIFLYSKGVFDEVVTRFIEGFDERDSQAEGRGFDILLEFPQYLIFGAGQGNYGAYSATNHEIHSTWFGILFYYGVIGFSIFMLFLYKIFKPLSISNKFLFLAPMFYGFTTYNARTIIFWFLLASFVLYQKSNRKELY